VENAAANLTAGDDRDAAHSDLVEACTGLRDHLVTTLPGAWPSDTAA